MFVSSQSGLGFWEKIQISWHLIIKSWGVLKKDKELLALPVIGAIVSIGVFAALLLPAFAFISAGQSERIYGVFIIYYFLATIVGVFFNAALVAGAIKRFSGGDPTVSSSIKEAATRLPAIIGWGIIASTVGLIVSSLRNRRQGGVADVVMSIAGAAILAAWNFISFMVLPVIVAEGKGPIASLKRSFELVRSRWGEVIAGGIGIWVAGSAAMFGLFAIIFALMFVSFTLFGFSLAVFATLMLVLIAGWLVLGIVFATLNQIFVAAVYLYAAKGTAHVFTKEEIKGILRSKHR